MTKTEKPKQAKRKSAAKAKTKTAKRKTTSRRQKMLDEAKKAVTVIGKAPAGIIAKPIHGAAAPVKKDEPIKRCKKGCYVHYLSNKGAIHIGKLHEDALSTDDKVILWTGTDRANQAIILQTPVSRVTHGLKFK